MSNVGVFEDVMKPPKVLDAITDLVLAYKPKARSKPAVQRKRRRTILQNQKKPKA